MAMAVKSVVSVSMTSLTQQMNLLVLSTPPSMSSRFVNNISYSVKISTHVCFTCIFPLASHNGHQFTLDINQKIVYLPFKTIEISNSFPCTLLVQADVYSVFQ